MVSASANGNGYPGDGNGYAPAAGVTGVTPSERAGEREAQASGPDWRRLLGIARRRWWILAGVGLLVGGGMAYQTLTQPPAYRDSFQILADPLVLDPSMQRGGEGDDGGDYQMQIRVLQTPGVLSEALPAIQERYPNIDYRTLRSNLSISRVGDTQTLEVSYESRDPRQIKYVLDQLAEAYVDYSLEAQKTAEQRGLQFVNQQIEKFRGEVNSLQQQLRQFRQNRFPDPQQRSGQLSSELNGILNQQRSNRIELERLRNLVQRKQRQLGQSVDSVIAMQSLSESPAYQQQLSALQNVNLQLAEASSELTDSHPRMQALRERRETLRSQLQQQANTILGPNDLSQQQLESGFSTGEQSSIRGQLAGEIRNLRNQIASLEEQQRALQQEESQLRASLSQMADANLQYSDLQRQLELANESLNRFLQRKQDMEIQQSREQQPWEVLAQASVPQEPFSPNIQRGLMLAAIAALLAGGGAAYLVERIDNTYYLAEDVEADLKLPRMGTIPFQASLSTPFQSASLTTHPFLESFRSLHANLFFVNPDRPPRSFVMSSSVAGEGRSTVAIELARTAAAAGERVLLVDANFRNPQIHELLGLPNAWGLSQTIAADFNTEETIQEYQPGGNLYVLTAGQIPPDPMPLLLSDKLATLIERWSNEFDRVIFDAPPSANVADAKLLATKTDGLMFVVGLGHTNRGTLHSVADELNNAQAPIIGMVTNARKRNAGSTRDRYEPQFSVVPSESTHLGAVLVQKHLISQQQLEWALEQQQQSGERLGEILVEQGWVTQAQLSQLLEEQQRLNQVFPAQQG